MVDCILWKSLKFTGGKVMRGWNISDIIKLALCWALTLSSSTLLTDIGPLSAVTVGCTESFAPATIFAFLIGAAVSSAPSGILFSKLGRYGGFTIGCLCQLFGSLSGALAILWSNAPLLLASCFAIGLGQGLGQFYRFAAIDVSCNEFKDRAVTYVLTGGVLAAFLGPLSATNTQHLFPQEYVGSYLMMAVYAICNQILLHTIEFPPPGSECDEGDVEAAMLLDGNDEEAWVQEVKNMTGRSYCDDIKCRSPGLTGQLQSSRGCAAADPDRMVNGGAPAVKELRSLCQIMTQPLFILACSTATIAHTVMVMFMAVFTIAMDAANFSFDNISNVMLVHLLAMFLPGFFTGHLISSHGTLAVSVVGAVVFACAVISFVHATALWQYFIGMVFIGLAWNLSFSAGTVMLTSCYTPPEAVIVQGINDVILFTVSGFGSVISGYLFSELGWNALLMFTVVLMGCNIAMVVVMWHISDVHSENFRAVNDHSSEQCGTRSDGFCNSENAVALGTKDERRLISSRCDYGTMDGESRIAAGKQKNGATCSGSSCALSGLNGGTGRSTSSREIPQHSNDYEFYSCQSSVIADDDGKYNDHRDDDADIVSSIGSGCIDDNGSPTIKKLAGLSGKKTPSVVSNTSSHPSSIHHVCKMVF